MGSNTYTEDELKKVLKNLFSEKKRVRDLEKQLEEKGLQKRFQAKLADVHKHSLADEYTRLKAVYLEKEVENDDLKSQIARVRPTLKKLMIELKSTTSEIEILKSQQCTGENEELKQALEEANHAVESLQESNQALLLKLSEHEKEVEVLNSVQCHTHKLEEECEGLREASRIDADNQQALEKQIRALDQDLCTARDALTQAQEKAQAHETTHMQHFELERGRLVERLAETVAQMQKQAEMLTQQREEIALLHNQIKGQEELQAEIVQLRAELESAQIQLQESDFVALRAEYESQMQEALRSFSQKEMVHEESLERCYVKMREMAQRHAEMVEEREMLYKKGEDHNKFLAKFEKEQNVLQISLKNIKGQYEEMETELIQSGQLLAKKVKETTLLGDLAESQQNQIMELQALNEKLVNSSAQVTENLTKEWQSKCLTLQTELEEQKGQLIELQNLRKTYEQMASTFSNLKTILGNTLEPLQPQSPQDPGN